MSLNQATSNTQKRAQVGLRASLIGLALNLVLAAGKIIFGSISGAVSVLADGINNLSDSASVLISWASLKLAQKPGDKDHPFGHGRMEYIGTLAIAVIILYIGIDLMKTSVQAIIKLESISFTWLLLGITALTIPVKLFMWRFYLRRATRYDIPSLHAAAKDSFNDVLITSSVVLGLLAFRFFGLQLDGWLGALVSLVILWNGISLIMETSTSIIGGKPDAEKGKRILEIIKKYPEILGVHDFVLHDYGPGRTLASLHAEVDAYATLLDIHDVIDTAEQEIMKELDLEITIHLDPVLPEGSPGQEVKDQLIAYLDSLQPPLKMHDFRLVPGKRVIKLIFDIEVPLDYHNDKLIEQVSAYAKTLDGRNQCFIQLDRDYFSDEAKPE